MATQTVESLIEGGKATAAPPLGPALGPTGVNIGQVVSEINKKTADMKGMQVPVKVTIDTATKQFTIEIGTPPAAALIKKEAGVEKGTFDDKIKSGKTELTAEEKQHLEQEKKKLQQDLEKRRKEFEVRAKDILKEFEKDPKKARKAMSEAGIPDKIINELAPAEEKKK